jgi:hypothetical protein
MISRKNELGGQIVEKLLSSSVEGEGIVTSLEMAMFARCAGTRLKRWIVEYCVLEIKSDSRIKAERLLDESRRSEEGVGRVVVQLGRR